MQTFGAFDQGWLVNAGRGAWLSCQTQETIGLLWAFIRNTRPSGHTVRGRVSAVIRRTRCDTDYNERYKNTSASS